MLADRVVEHLDIIEHVLLALLADFAVSTPDVLTLELNSVPSSDSG
jgi:hypothetical protein